jgi:hypothetical protein
MTKHPRDVNPDLVRQEIEQGRKGDRELAKKPGETPQRRPAGTTDDSGPVWDEDQRQLIENQDANEIERSGRQGSE